MIRIVLFGVLGSLVAFSEVPFTRNIKQYQTRFDNGKIPKKEMKAKEYRCKQYQVWDGEHREIKLKFNKPNIARPNGTLSITYPKDVKYPSKNVKYTSRDLVVKNGSWFAPDYELTGEYIRQVGNRLYIESVTQEEDIAKYTQSIADPDIAATLYAFCFVAKN